MMMKLLQVPVASDIPNQPSDCYSPHLGSVADLARQAVPHHARLSHDSHLGGALPCCYSMLPPRCQTIHSGLGLYYQPVSLTSYLCLLLLSVNTMDVITQLGYMNYTV